MGMVWVGLLIDLGKAERVFALKRYIAVIPEMAMVCAFTIDKKREMGGSGSGKGVLYSFPSPMLNSAFLWNLNVGRDILVVEE